MNIKPYQKRTWAEIDLDAIKFNYQQIKSAIKSQTKICCVIKANAYGHGAPQLAPLYEEMGADYFAVSNIEEALQLRKSKITRPILILGYTDPECAYLLASNNISQCVFSEKYGIELSKNACGQGVNVKIHIKIDTGMGRIGFVCRKKDELNVDSIYRTCKLPGISAEGIFTHFASADEGKEGEEYTREQFRCLVDTILLLRNRNIFFSICHCSNSAAIFEYPEMQLDMVRAGIVLYGLYPSDNIKEKVKLKQAITLHTIIDYIKTIDEKDSVSYGRTYTASSKRVIATIPVGYADGLWRENSQVGMLVEVNGSYAPIVGRICMDQCMIDVTEIKNINIGSPVTIYGEFGDNSIDNIAKKNKTINYEIVCEIGERVPRVYKSNGKIVKIVDNIVRD